jgi:hypothetical protein
MQTFSDTLGQVFRAIMANKLRTFLTMFGIAWGVGSLLVLVGLGEGFRSGQHKEFASLGNDVVMMFNGTIPALANQHTGMRPYQLTLGDEAALRQLPELRAVTAELVRSDLYEVSQWSNTSGHVTGTEPNYTVVRFIPMAQGRFLDDADVREYRRVAVLGQKTASLLFPAIPCWARHHHQRNRLHRHRPGRQDRPGQQHIRRSEDLHPHHHHAGAFSPQGRQHCPRCADLDPVPTGDRRATRRPRWPPCIASSPSGTASTPPSRTPSMSGTPSRKRRWWAPSSPPWTSSWAGWAS